HQFVKGKLVDCYEPKVRAVTSNKMVVVGKDEFQLQLVGTAGQDDTTLPHSFVISIHSYVLVYLVTSLGSGGVPHPPHAHNMPVVRTGNKVDLSLWEVKMDEGKKLVESWGAIFLEASAKERQVTWGIFTKIIEELNWVDNSFSRSTGCCLT
uniref:RHEB like 1 n=1 Tax=Calidris pygmaea TaxID=425635 RepID=A0A8C3PU47_9CHAR